ncbi:alpha-L-glutamate ligase-like protein [Terasakiispira papahanaumokuakeensis]|uniref:Alpha-L-glutamate ligase-like protein n=1 Tax=Terasakiispira papahanaumokuakeensis TaxID=197479 RepID=A0A1E2V8Q5_9GAMM|nr:alpha-L-glutamate ligase-like protein [Terasakiispira papahanaumokuakeensis]ODC03388.1 alpha-L-glutamate ligase-like protein [Terasakiispira papahanaumokuakeensis]
MKFVDILQQWSRPLRDKGVMGLNERNISYINRYNSRHLYPRVDDKLKTKLLAERYRINTPELLGVIRSHGEIKRLAEVQPAQGGFAIKPSKGSGGKGILVIQQHDGERYQKASGEWIDRSRVERHLSNLISGLYSLGGSPDVAIIERLINFDPAYSDFTFEGVPDIRVIVFKGYPVMAMMRLSTKSSDGKANLHQGAIGVGLDLASGKATRAVQHDRPVMEHPDTGQALSELIIPDWQHLLTLAASCYDMAGLGYLGADLVLDKDYGPQLLELNARPGLAIQLANGCGLKPRLALVESLDEETPDRPDAADRVAWAQKQFSTPEVAFELPVATV